MAESWNIVPARLPTGTSRWAAASNFTASHIRRSIALSVAGNPPVKEVLAIGDGLQTDILGAARMGFDAVFVTGGIHAGEPFPADFASANGLGDWKPVAIVDGLQVSP